MTVAELINVLRRYDPDLPVLVDGYEGGYEDLLEGLIRVQSVVLDVLKEGHEAFHYLGKHGDPYPDGTYTDASARPVDVLLLSRPYR